MDKGLTLKPDHKSDDLFEISDPENPPSNTLFGFSNQVNFTHFRREL